MNDKNNSKPESNGRASGLLSKLTHGFAPSILHGCDCKPGYGEARGVSIKVENLVKSFDGNLVLKGINLEIKAGEVFSIIGPSGTGKSVLLKHMVKLDRKSVV